MLQALAKSTMVSALHCGTCNHAMTKREAAAGLGQDVLARYFPAVIPANGIPLFLLCSIANQEQLSCPECGAKGKWMDQPPAADSSAS